MEAMLHRARWLPSCCQRKSDSWPFTLVCMTVEAIPLEDRGRGGDEHIWLLFSLSSGHDELHDEHEHEDDIVRVLLLLEAAAVGFAGFRDRR